MERLFDLKNDPFEQNNMVTRTDCNVHFKKYDQNSITSVVDSKAGEKYCTNLLNSKKVDSVKRGLISRNLLPSTSLSTSLPSTSLHSTSFINEMDNNSTDDTVVSTVHSVRSLSDTDALSICVTDYHLNVVNKLLIMMPKLSAFVLHGNKAYTRFIKESKEEPVARTGAGTGSGAGTGVGTGSGGGIGTGVGMRLGVGCSTPIASELKGLTFELSPGTYVLTLLCFLVYCVCTGHVCMYSVFAYFLSTRTLSNF